MAKKHQLEGSFHIILSYILSVNVKINIEGALYNYVVVTNGRHQYLKFHSQDNFKAAMQHGMILGLFLISSVLNVQCEELATKQPFIYEEVNGRELAKVNFFTRKEWSTVGQNCGEMLAETGSFDVLFWYWVLGIGYSGIYIHIYVYIYIYLYIYTFSNDPVKELELRYLLICR